MVYIAIHCESTVLSSYQSVIGVQRVPTDSYLQPNSLESSEIDDRILVSNSYQQN